MFSILPMNPTLPARMIPCFPPRWADVFGEDDCGVFAECEVRGVRFVWRWIPPGKFTMGSPDSENSRWDNEGPQHEVVLTKGFWLGETPVTQAQWEAVAGQNPSRFKRPDRPVEQVSWLDCCEFIQQVNGLLPGLHAALPTEAQWEYACRAGTQSAFNDGSPCTKPDGLDPALDALGWFDENSSGETHPVRQKRANAWGLHDMHGNVWEWCRDQWDADAYQKRRGIVVDPELRGDGSGGRVARGGSWIDQARLCRAAFRDWDVPSDRGGNLGLRLSAGRELAAERPNRRAEGRGPEVAAERPTDELEWTRTKVQASEWASAEKILTRTDVSAGASHGREIVGNGALRKLLGQAEVEGAVAWVHFGEAGVEEARAGRYKWHQARANVPSRRPEWRLYYGDSLPGAAREGDVLVVVKWGNTLCGLVFHPEVPELGVWRQWCRAGSVEGEDAQARWALIERISGAFARVGNP
jgi:formylglycine-generating enzyme required for sulfatase activity